MSRRIMSMLMSARTVRSLAITLGTLMLVLLLTSLAGCSSTATPPVNQKPVVSQPLDQSVFIIKDLAVSPVKVSKGDAVTIVANVVNTSLREGVYNAELKINNAPVALKSVTIPAGVTQTLNFIVPATAAGTYEAIFGDLSGKYTVADQAEVIKVNNISGSNSASTSAVPASSCCSPATTQSTPTSSSAGGCCAAPIAIPNSKPSTPALPSRGGGGCCGG
jgi:hypothetical protein